MATADNFNKDNFFEMVYEVVKLIPEGKVTSYGAIANYLGATRSARMVGYAMNSVPQHTEYVPAHRVVNRTGLLTGKHHFIPESQMQELLEKEGIAVKDNQIIDFDKHFWDPNKELRL